jgi:PPK2 family polyphosphate:nucleotide phosphotransferase
MATSLRETLRVRPRPVRLADYDPGATPGFDGGKKAGRRALEKLAGPFGDLQKRLYAESRAGGTRRILLVLQGMDTSGKSGTIKHCAGLLDPQGLSITAFKAPTPAERRHDFLWRVERRTPEPGMLGIFDRSHYEDVLAAKVHGLADAAEIRRRYVAINDFERRLTEDGTTVVKCFLHITKETQDERLLARLESPKKRWKFNPNDLEERRLWPDYQRAYEIAFERCSTKVAPWYVVPSDRKWYRNWAVTTLLLEHLKELDPQWPVPEFDVKEQKKRLAET